jgi:formyl-CoA transferase/CoA:oxalate CoA-transferase
VPYETFATADGELAVGVGSDRQWVRFCEALGMPALADDPRFATNGDRVDRRAELVPLLADRMAERTTTDWLAAFGPAGVPAGPIRDVLAAFEDPQSAARGMSQMVEHELLGVLRQVGVPFELSATPAAVRTPPPLLGEHTEEVLAELAYDRAEIDRLRAAGVV